MSFAVDVPELGHVDGTVAAKPAVNGAAVRPPGTTTVTTATATGTAGDAAKRKISLDQKRTAVGTKAPPSTVTTTGECFFLVFVFKGSRK